MKQQDNKIDWSVLSKAIILFLCSLMVGLLFVLSGVWFYHKTELAHKKIKKEINLVRQDHISLKQDKKYIDNYMEAFQSLYDQGILGQENRLDLVENLNNIQQDIMFINFSYEMKPQQIYTPSYVYEASNYQLYSSRILLKLGVLHENDFLKFLQKLNQINGHFNFRECNFVANHKTPILDDLSKANIRVECDIDWITISLASDTNV